MLQRRFLVEYSLIQLNETALSSVFYTSRLSKRNPTVRERTMAERDGNRGNPGPVTSQRSAARSGEFPSSPVLAHTYTQTARRGRVTGRRLHAH